MFCPQCGKEVADDQMFCQQCGAKLREEAASYADATVTSEAGSRTAGREKTPWEDREARGFFPGLFGTLNNALFRPSEFFRKMPVAGGLTDPLLYALIVGMVGLIFSYVWQMLMNGAMTGFMMGGIQTPTGMFHGFSMTALAFLSPFLIILGLFVSAGILHVCLMMVKGTKYGFEATFRVAAYGYSAHIFLVIPICGGIFAGLWALVLYIIGLREAHETTGGKATFAVFLPAIICCGFILFAIVLFLGAAAGSLGTMMQVQR